MDISTLYALIGFLLASYSVIANDSVQTLGTFIASNNRVFKWYWLWLAASAVLAFTLIYGWYVNDGDISYGRLDRIPPIKIEWYHAAAPAVLVLLTRIGIPVSTTFLVLSVFASTFILEKMLVKSIVGYGVAAIVAYALWVILSKFINEKFNTVKKHHRVYWRTAQWCATGFLWFSWLSHDMANIAVYLPRQLPIELLLGCIFILIFWLGVIFKTHGGKIQKIILEKTGSRFMRSATIIDLVYACLLIFFKDLNNIPMSTTWVFVGLLTGRELAIATVHRKEYQLGYVFPLIGKDFLKMMIGLAVSVALVLSIHYFINPE
jgi:phosphate/sulfate permease